MCLIVVALRAHPRYPLVLLANRDEAYARPAHGAQRWVDAPHVFGGRDLEKGGTWLAVVPGPERRIAAVTNVRHPTARRVGLSRGALVRAALDGALPEGDALDAYPAFNLLAGSETHLEYRNEEGAREVLRPGLHGLSNARIDVPWPKVERARAGLERLLGAATLDFEAAFALLHEQEEAPEARLPDTGVPKELELRLSPAFIAMPGYGTRASTVVAFDRDGSIRFAERTFGEGGAPIGQVEATL